MHSLGIKRALHLCVLLFSLFLSLRIYAQTSSLTGKVTDPTGGPLSGATVTIKGDRKSTTTNEQGEFTFSSAPQNGVLLISYAGYLDYETRFTAGSPVTVSLSPNEGKMEEVVVTGTFDARKKLEASVAISTLNSQQLTRLQPVSAADVLRNVPGVFVNSAGGETRNSIATRGITVRPQYNQSQSGLTYVSMQEDGLPITNLYVTGLHPDLFLRTDATLNKLEAVRGGTASIIGANAPGGIFNYLSKTGTAKFSGEARAKVGLQGDGENAYSRADLNFGGPMGKGGWTYNVGGFYRYDQGARYPGYPFNYGGQVKANIQKKYDKGTITFFAKYLNDHNGQFMNLIGRNFDKPELAPGVENTFAFTLPEVSLYVPQANATYNSKNLLHSKSYSLGANWKHNFSNGFSIQNNLKFSNSQLIQNSTAAVNPLALTSLITNAQVGATGRGIITYKNHQTGQVLATVHARTPNYTVLTNKLPGQDILQNGILYNGAYYANTKMNEWMDQVVLTKKVGNMTFNLGAFAAFSDVPMYSAGITGLAYTTLEKNPQLLDITFYDSVNRVTKQITSPEGFGKTGGVTSYNSFEMKKTDLAPFFGHNWQITNKLNLDWGVRFEYIKTSGVNYRRSPNNGADGGLDGNPLTIYDNTYYTNPTEVDFSFKTSTWSYSAALNYLLSDNQAAYLRYSVGRKAPDGQFYQTIDTKERLALTQVEVEKIEQVELGYKLKAKNLELNVTPFYSKVSNIFQTANAQDSVGLLYNLQPYFNTTVTKGVELESILDVTKNFNIRAIATVQTSKFTQFRTADQGPTTSKRDDATFNYSGNYTDATPNFMLGITPTYSTAKFYAFLSYQYTGKRWANVPNAFKLPGYSQLDLGLGYNFTNNLALTLNINNLTNSFGVMTWGPPGGIPAVFNLQTFTPARKEAQKNALFPIGGTAPRAYFLTLTYKFQK